jgi:aminoglycoside phosphotransferase (APT) family kinase protein
MDEPGDKDYNHAMPSLTSPLATGRTAEIYAWENDCILKLTRAEFPAILADQEWQQSEAAWKLGAPVPRPIALIEVDGRRGVVFQRVDGPSMSQAIQRWPWRLNHYARLLARLHAGLHQLSAPGFPSLNGRVRWNLSQNNLLDEKRTAAVLELLERLPESDTLCHGDFHPENVLLAGTGPVIIDWEGSMHADPAADVANTCLVIRSALMIGSGPDAWLMRQVARRFEQVYLSTYWRNHGPIDHLQEWMAVHAARMMTEEHISKHAFYEQIVRRVIPDW